MYYNLKKKAKNIIFGITPYIPFNRLLYLKNINYRSGLPFTEILELAKPVSFLSAFTYERHIPNEFYGHATVLKKFCGLPNTYQLKFNIEHGVSMTNDIAKLDVDSPFPTIATPGKSRAKFLKNYKPYSFTLGPYIYYAHSLLLSKQLENEKKRLGRNLLVFPSHSTIDVKTTFNIEDFCQKIRYIGKNFDTVRICLYWKEILDGKYNTYKKFGFECITAGHILDINFLPRLKSIISLSSLTISNNPGTQIGYCIAMKKPHCLIEQNHIFTGLRSEVRLVRSGYENDNTHQIIEIFKQPNLYITKKQFKFVNQLWGLNQTKSRKELLKIINFAERRYHEKQ